MRRCGNATRRRTAHARQRSPTNGDGGEHVGERDPSSSNRSHSTFGPLERVDRVAEVRELGQEEIERGDAHRDDREQGAGLDAFEPFERELPRRRSAGTLRAADHRATARPYAVDCRIGAGDASGWRSGSAAPTRAETQRFARRIHRRSAPTSSEVSTSTCATSRARSSPSAASSASSKSTRWGRRLASTMTFSEREVPMADPRAVQHVDLRHSAAEQRRVQGTGPSSVSGLPVNRVVTSTADPSVVAPDTDDSRVSIAPCRVRLGGRASRARCGVSRSRRAARLRRPGVAPSDTDARGSRRCDLRGAQLRRREPLRRRSRVRTRASRCHRLRSARPRRSGTTERSNSDELGRIGGTVRRTEHDERERADDHANRDREDDIERARRRRQQPQDGEDDDRSPQRALPTAGSATRPRASRRPRSPRGSPSSGSRDRRSSPSRPRCRRSRAFVSGSSNASATRCIARVATIEPNNNTPSRRHWRRTASTPTIASTTLAPSTCATPITASCSRDGIRPISSIRSACAPPTVSSAIVANTIPSTTSPVPMSRRMTSLALRTRFGSRDAELTRRRCRAAARSRGLRTVPGSRQRHDLRGRTRRHRSPLRCAHAFCSERTCVARSNSSTTHAVMIPAHTPPTTSAGRCTP